MSSLNNVRDSLAPLWQHSVWGELKNHLIKCTGPMKVGVELLFEPEHATSSKMLKRFGCVSSKRTFEILENNQNGRQIINYLGAMLRSDALVVEDLVRKCLGKGPLAFLNICLKISIDFFDKNEPRITAGVDLCTGTHYNAFIGAVLPTLPGRFEAPVADIPAARFGKMLLHAVKQKDKRAIASLLQKEVSEADVRKAIRYALSKKAQRMALSIIREKGDNFSCKSKLLILISGIRAELQDFVGIFIVFHLLQEKSRDQFPKLLSEGLNAAAKLGNLENVKRVFSLKSYFHPFSLPSLRQALQMATGELVRDFLKQQLQSILVHSTQVRIRDCLSKIPALKSMINEESVNSEDPELKEALPNLQFLEEQFWNLVVELSGLWIKMDTKGQIPKQIEQEIYWLNSELDELEICVRRLENQKRS